MRESNFQGKKSIKERVRRFWEMETEFWAGGRIFNAFRTFHEGITPRWALPAEILLDTHKYRHTHMQTYTHSFISILQVRGYCWSNTSYFQHLLMPLCNTMWYVWCIWPLLCYKHAYYERWAIEIIFHAPCHRRGTDDDVRWWDDEWRIERDR